MQKRHIQKRATDRTLCSPQNVSSQNVERVAHFVLAGYDPANISVILLLV